MLRAQILLDLYIHFVYTAIMASKKLISLRIDQKILDWFRKRQPVGYQTLIHSVLEEYVNDKEKQLARAAGRAQEIFRQYHAQCFWHYDPCLVITPENISLVIEGLRKYGGKQGMALAEELAESSGLCH